MELRQYLAMGLKWWWLIAGLTIAVSASSYFVSERQPAVYQAATTIIVGQAIQTADVSTADFQAIERLAQTYADMARRQPVLQAVVETIGLKQSWEKLKDQVSAKPISGTQLLGITVEAHSPEEARIIADEIARQLILLSPTNLENREQDENQRLIRQRVQDLEVKIKAGRERVEALETRMTNSLSAQEVKDLQREINDLEGLITEWENNSTQLLIFVESKKSPNYLAVIESAQGSPYPIRPRTQLNIVLAAMVGILLAIGFIFLLEYMDDTLKTTDDLNQSLNLTVLGVISRIKGEHYQDKRVAIQDPFSPIAEAYRMIRSNIQFKSVDQPIKSIVITSSNPGEGKSITVANLGVIMAQAGLKTVIVDADLRRPVQHQIFQVPNLGGLTELLCSSGLEIETQMRRTKIENLLVLTSGVLPPNPAELLASRRMAQLLANLNEVAEVVLYDSPPVLAVTDATVLSNRADGVVLVIEAGRTRRDMARQAIINLQQADANLLGGVLNRVSQKSKEYYYQGYYTTNERRPTVQPIRSTSKRRWQWLPFFK